MLGTAVSQGVYFYLYSRFRQIAVTRLQTQQNTKSEDIGVGGSLLVAALAGCGNVLLTTPIWTVATRMQVCCLSASESICSMNQVHLTGPWRLYDTFQAHRQQPKHCKIKRIVTRKAVTVCDCSFMFGNCHIAVCVCVVSLTGTSMMVQAQQKKAGGLPDPKKREGPVKTAQEIYEESGVKVRRYLHNSQICQSVTVMGATVQLHAHSLAVGILVTRSWSCVDPQLKYQVRPGSLSPCSSPVHYATVLSVKPYLQSTILFLCCVTTCISVH